ncbi:MAG: hypothetical protein RLY31_284 [Bacteroidota bacterium]|jgi:glycosyltransferase involved in cell wall biosynthesis
MRRRVLIVDNSAWCIYNFRMPLVRRLSRADYEVWVATPIDQFYSLLDKSAIYRYVPLRHLERRGRNPFRDLLLLLELYRLYRTVRPDVVVHFTMKPVLYGALLARLTKIRSIGVLTGLGYLFLHDNWLNRVVRRGMRLLFNGLDTLVTYNTDDRQLLVSQAFIPPSKCTVLPGDGVDVQRFRPQPPQAGDGKFVFLFIGRMLGDKGVEEYVAAAARLNHQCPETKFQLLADFQFGNPNSISARRLQEWAVQGTVQLLPTTTDVVPHLRDCDALVLPSYREGLSRVILEAMAMGKPVITTDVPGCKDLVMHGRNGLVVPAGNARALQEAMHYLRYCPPAELAAMGLANRRRVLQYFAEDICMEAFMEVLERNQRVCAPVAIAKEVAPQLS